jgi:hypothetical protein
MKETDHLGEDKDGRIILQWMLNTIWGYGSCAQGNETSVSLESEKFIYQLSDH